MIIVLCVVAWFSIGYYGLYKYTKYEKISSAYNSRWYDCRIYINFDIFDYIICISFSFIGPISIITWIFSYLINRDNIIKFKIWRKTEELNSLSIREIRKMKLKKLSK